MDPSFHYSGVNMYTGVMTCARKVERDDAETWREDHLGREMEGNRCYEMSNGNMLRVVLFREEERNMMEGTGGGERNNRNGI